MGFRYPNMCCRSAFGILSVSAIPHGSLAIDLLQFIRSSDPGLLKLRVPDTDQTPAYKLPLDQLVHTLEFQAAFKHILHGINEPLYRCYTLLGVAKCIKEDMRFNIDVGKYQKPKPERISYERLRWNLLVLGIKQTTRNGTGKYKRIKAINPKPVTPPV